MIADGIATNPGMIRKLLSERKFAELAMEVGIKVVHCSELDTQIPFYPKRRGEFINTWSIDGFHEEAIAPAEVGWGTHETNPPINSYFPPQEPDNELIFRNMGMKTWIRSWVPNQEITGMVIRHGEAFGLSDRWTVRREGIPIYRPTVCYVYRPCTGTLESLAELEMNDYQLPGSLRILDGGEIRSGEDILGALLMGHPYGSWWTGSILSIEEARMLQPGNNATTIQVGIGIVAAVMWMIEHPDSGFCLPDDLPHDYILNIATPFLGQFYSGPSSWTPEGYEDKAGPDDRKKTVTDQVWQFHNFF
jgi:homospermidine synthase